MRNLMREKVTIVHRDGKKHENIHAAVTPKKIYIRKVTVPISVGDKIQRNLPSGQEEVFMVTNVHLLRGGVRIPDTYEISYEREGTQRRRSQHTSLNFNVSNSPQARINFNSTDQSTNTIHYEAEEIFSRIRQLLSESITKQPELDHLLDKVNEMESSLGSSDFKKAYKDFITTGADHMTVLAPILPALTGLLL